MISAAHYPLVDAAFHMRVSEDLEDQEWDNFLATTPGGHHVQTSCWSRVKAVLHWKTLRVVAVDSQGILCGAQLLTRPITPLLTAAYLTKGPVARDADPPVMQAATKAVLQTIIRACCERHIQLLAVQPPNNGQEISPLLRALNFSPCSLDLAPTASIILDLDAEPDQLLKGMKRQTRQNIHRGELAGLKVRDGSEGDLEAFYHLHQSTAKRQGFYPYSLEYYRAMWKVFQPVGGIGLVIAEHDEKPISALLLIPFGDTVIAKILGWSGERAELRPNDAVFWNAILWSKQRGYRHFDFEGIDLQGARAVLESGSLPDKLQHSPDFFKLGYGGHVVLYPPAFDLVPNPLLRWAYKKLSPQVGGESTISHIVDKIRKL